MYRGEGKKKICFENIKKEFQSALFRSLWRWTGNNFLFKGGLSITTHSPGIVTDYRTHVSNDPSNYQPLQTVGNTSPSRQEVTRITEIILFPSPSPSPPVVVVGER